MPALAGRGIPTPWILIDELLHAGLARRLRAGDGYSVRGSMLFSRTLMLENLFLPLFVTACLVCALALERPTLARQGPRWR